MEDPTDRTANRTDKQKFDDLFRVNFASPEESAKKMAELRKKGVHQDDIVSINGKVYYIDYPGYDSYTNPEPKPVYYEMKKLRSLSH